LLNDCFDLEADRTHPFKQKRPLAAGSLSISSALVLIPLLALASLWISLVLSTAFFQILLLYLILTTAYSFYFKRIALADGILLSSLYILRIIAGGVITEVLVSEWLLGFAMFFFLSLAFAKRYAELFRLSSQTSTIAKGRGYSAEDLTALAIFGIVSGYISVTILALYTNSEEMRRLYTTPEALWLICPLLLYWISRIWLLSYQGQMLEDPLVFALRDSVSYATGFLTALFLFLAK
jgi:4-hydroxybenzoate polyprenyltransferase